MFHLSVGNALNVGSQAGKFNDVVCHLGCQTKSGRQGCRPTPDVALLIFSDTQPIDDLENRRQEATKEDTNLSVIELRHYGTELLTREIGVVIRADVATKLIGGNNVNVSFKGISDFTPSVVDEAFGKLALEIGFDEFSKRVQITEGSPMIERLIDFVLKTRQSRL